MSVPLVSVITVNRDMAADLESTLESVLVQDYPRFESIVIDGGSRDGSRAVIQAHAARLAHWVSEPDKSLYDAMNKGVAAAKGDWILFMNSGDRFAGPDVLSRVFAADRREADVLYGHHVRIYPDSGIERLVPAEPPSVLPRRMHCSHQALLMRREWLAGHPFEIDLLAADYESVLAAHAAGGRFVLVDCIIARTRMGGRSDTNRLLSLRQRAAIVRRHGRMSIGLAWYYRWLMMRAGLAAMAKKILPDAMIARIQRSRPVKGLG
jgi:glycosyltransferase involved in cell wall biosynthesis